MYTRRLLLQSFCARNWHLVAGALISGLLNSFLTILLLVSIGTFYELSLQSATAKGELLKQFGVVITSIQGFFLFYGSLIGGKGLCHYLSLLLTGVVNERFALMLRKLLFIRQTRQPVLVFKRRSVSKYLLRYSSDLSSIQRFIGSGVIGFAADVLFLLLALGLLYSMSSKLTLCIIASFAIAAVILFMLGFSVRKVAIDQRVARSRVMQFISSRLNSFYTIKTFNREQLEQQAFSRRADLLYLSSVRYVSKKALIKATLPVLYFSMMCFLLFVIHSDISFHDGSFSSGTILVFVLVVIYMQGLIKRLLNVNVIWQQGLISLDNLLAIANRSVEKSDAVKAIKQFRGSLSVQGVTFSYDGTNTVVEDFGFDAPRRKTTLLLGERSSGKSTVLKLLAALHAPQKGTMLIDGIDYASLSPSTIRGYMTLMSDDVALLGKTVFEAICSKDNDACRNQAAWILSELKFRSELSQEKLLSFPLEENAANMSTGERKLLRYAQALLADKPILLIDDPIKDLDDASAARVIKLLNSLHGKKTLVIASSIIPEGLECDQLIKLRNGVRKPSRAKERRESAVL